MGKMTINGEWLPIFDERLSAIAQQVYNRKVAEMRAQRKAEMEAEVNGLHSKAHLQEPGRP